jgi:hypothetical protein
MSKSSSEIKDDEKEEENADIDDNTEENVMNNKNRIFYFSMNLSKYKNYTLNNKSITKTNTNTKKISIKNTNTIDNEKVNEEKINEKVNSYNRYNYKKGYTEDYNNSDKKSNKSQISSEQIFLRQKERIKLMKEKTLRYNNSLLNKNESNKKEKNDNNNNNNQNEDNIDDFFNEINPMLNDQFFNDKLNSTIKQRISFKETCLFLTLDKPQYFEVCLLNKKNTSNVNESEDEDREEEEIVFEIIPLINNNWMKVKNFNKINNCIEFSNMAIRTLNEVNYNTNGVEINVELSLIGDGEFWIFSRCFVNKDFNDSKIFDTCSLNNDSDVIFNKYTSLIKLIKEKNSNKCFVTFGTFYEDEADDNKIKYVTFLKRQLVDYSHANNANVYSSNLYYYYLENDLIDIKIIITDLGNEEINTKIFINKNQKFNFIEGKFYLPTNKRSKILFCGLGQSVPVRRLRINNIDKLDDDNNELTKKSCTCCNIY